MIALQVFVKDKVMTFQELLLYFEFRLAFTVHLVFLFLFATLCDSQSQVLNSNLLRDKL